MEEKEVLSKVADTIIQKPVTVTIDILKVEQVKFIMRLLIKLKVIKPKPTKRTFEIKQAPLGTLIKISKELIDIDLKLFDASPGAFLESNYRLMQTHGERMARIAAIAVSNPRDEPDSEIINFFLDNLTSKELYYLASIVIQQMDIINFMNTIISIKGVNVLQQKTATATSANKNEVSQ